MSVDEAIVKLDKHVTSLTGLSSSTFVLQVTPLCLYSWMFCISVI